MFQVCEESQHLFFKCSVSDQLRRSIFEWLGMQPMEFNDSWDYLVKHGIKKWWEEKQEGTVSGLGCSSLCDLDQPYRVIFRGGVLNASHMLSHVKGN